MKALSVCLRYHKLYSPSPSLPARRNKPCTAPLVEMQARFASRSSATAYRNAARSTRRVVVVRASAERSLAKAQPVVAAFAAAVLLTTQHASASDEAPQTTAQTSSSPSSISFARVSADTTRKLRERDDNMAWKCQGISMYDCDGELQAAAEKRFEEVGKALRDSAMASPFVGGNSD